MTARACLNCVHWSSDDARIWGDCGIHRYEDTAEPAIMHCDEGHDCEEFKADQRLRSAANTTSPTTSAA